MLQQTAQQHAKQEQLTRTHPYELDEATAKLQAWSSVAGSALESSSKCHEVTIILATLQQRAKEFKNSPGQQHDDCMADKPSSCSAAATPCSAVCTYIKRQKQNMHTLAMMQQQLNNTHS